MKPYVLIVYKDWLQGFFAGGYRLTILQSHNVLMKIPGFLHPRPSQNDTTVASIQ